MVSPVQRKAAAAITERQLVYRDGMHGVYITSNLITMVACGLKISGYRRDIHFIQSVPPGTQCCDAVAALLMTNMLRFC